MLTGIDCWEETVISTNSGHEHRSGQWKGTGVGNHARFDVADRPPHQYTGDEYFAAAAASDILLWRNAVIHDLNSRGVLALDNFPEEMTAPLINAYLEIKARHLL